MNKRRLHIGMVAPLYTPVPPIGYGGTELVVSMLTEELIKRGHRVTLFASGDSRTSAKLQATVPIHLFKLGIPVTDLRYPLLHLYRAFRQADQFDLIHTHVDTIELFFPAFVDTPTIHTIHQPLCGTALSQGFGFKLQILKEFKRNKFVAISQNMKKTSEVKLNFVDTIYHGIPVEKFRFFPKPKNHLVFLGRTNWLKGIDVAIKAAHKAGVKLLVGGPALSQAHYFNTEIRPLMKKTGARYVGEVSVREKNAFVGQALGLLNPIQWEEPFGLNMIEAMASGTPVIATRRGSVPEIVKHGKTGFIADDFNGLVKAIQRLQLIDRKACRQHVERYFTLERMVDQYEDLYYRLLRRRRL